MKRRITIALALLCLATTAIAPAATPAASGSKAAAALIDSYSSAYRALGMADIELSYQTNIANLVRETDIPKQRQLFAGYARQLAALDTRGLDACTELDLKMMGFEIALNQDKLALLEQYEALTPPAQVSDQGLFYTPLGQAWYAYMLKRWLTSEVTPRELVAMGNAELDAALARYHALQARMGYAGRDQAFIAYLAGPDFLYAQDQTPQADYEAKQTIVFGNLDKLFPRGAVQPARIAASQRGPAFPADAYYEPDENTFYFNNSKPRYEKRALDMLLLHESTPGHHYQSSYARLNRVCPVRMPPVFYSAYAEGWGAYVEEFGAQLGLYQHDADALGAVEWDLVRSIRVALDVGINSEGWSRQRALDYWHAKLPMLPDSLAEREIARVRNWPAQAITYKLGAVQIRALRAREQAREGAAFDLRRFHQSVLQYGAVPLALLPTLPGLAAHN